MDEKNRETEMSEKFNFDKTVNREGSGSVKWDHTEKGVIPMWVADMDFKTAPCIIEALRERVDHGVFGYVDVPESYYDSIINWFERRHGWKISRDSIMYTIGVVPAISAVIKGLTKPGDGVIMLTPVYNCFYSSIRNNGCEVVECPLIYRPEGYLIDFDKFEAMASSENVKLMLLCNPHNPIGRVWTREELLRIGEICLKHDVFVVSDEIHCELTFKGHDYTPYQTIGEEYAVKSVTCSAPSKAFNIAGLQNANIMALDAEVRRKIDRAINDNEVCDVNPFGVVAVRAAYDYGEDWLDALRDYLWGNYQITRSFFEENMPQLKIVPLEGTYLVWINCESIPMTSEELVERMTKEAGVRLSPGTLYGAAGEHFLRLNIACPRITLTEGLERMKKFFSKI